MKVFRFSNKVILASGVVVLLLIGLAGMAGWQYRERATLQRVDVSGARISSEERIRELAALEEGALLYAVSLDSVEVRVLHHPWIESASAKRTATGKIRIRVTERRPVAIYLPDSGEGCYADALGFCLPLVDGFAFDVPVIRSRLTVTSDGHHRRFTGTGVREMLAAIAGLDDRTLALVSEIEEDSNGGLTVRTTPIPGRDSIPVALGKGDYEKKLIRLAAFWEQVLLRQPDQQIRSIDLRYNNQILTT